MKNTLQKSKLQQWLDDHSMTTTEFSLFIKCSLPTLWKVKMDLPIIPSIADRIEKFTGGSIIPKRKKLGRVKKTVMNTSTVQENA